MNKDQKIVVLLGYDGYIGNALLQRLLKLGYKVFGIDNHMRRKWVKEDMNSMSATPIDPYRKYSLESMGNVTFFRNDITENTNVLEHIMNENDVDIVINLAHIPSGPYSQISQQHANITLTNNIIGTNNVLWLMKKYIPNAHYITIGTTGEYDHYSNIPIYEGYCKMKWHDRVSNEMIFPRRPGSIYHTSKVASTYLIDFLTRSWGLKCTDIMQSIVFGMYTDDIDKSKIWSRLDSDEAAGTVIHRFVIQSILGVPLTIYGEGCHKRGFLSLNDSIQALMIAVNNEPESGRVQVWNQLSEWHSMNDIADMVMEVGDEFDLDVKTQHITSPRNEFTGDHYYYYKTDILKNFGYKPTRTIKNEIRYMFENLLPRKKELEPLKNVVIPKIKWS